jgi:hypothetical protein
MATIGQVAWVEVTVSGDDMLDTSLATGLAVRVKTENDGTTVRSVTLSRRWPAVA